MVGQDMTGAGVTVAEIRVADDAEAWTAAGFGVGPDGVCRVGGVGIRLVGRDTDTDTGTGIVGWSLRGLVADHRADLDGVPTTSAADGPAAQAPSPPVTHRNGVVGIDHVVLMSPDLARTVGAFDAIGVPVRRIRDVDLGGRPMRQIFLRLGEVILEVVGSPDATSGEPSTLWGVTYTVDDVDASARFFGADTTPVKPAVQPGRRITTLRHAQLGISVRTALISAPVDRASR